jgi:hypothetical protein
MTLSPVVLAASGTRKAKVQAGEVFLAGVF